MQYEREKLALWLISTRNHGRDIRNSSSLRSGPNELTNDAAKLGKVCSRWCGIAWSTARIWSSVYLRLSRRPYQAQAALLRALLDRSGRDSLMIHLKLEDESVWTHAAPQKVVAVPTSKSKKMVFCQLCTPRSVLSVSRDR